MSETETTTEKEVEVTEEVKTTEGVERPWYVICPLYKLIQFLSKK